MGLGLGLGLGLGSQLGFLQASDPNPNPNPNPTQETNILRGNYAFKGRAWADVSDQAKDFISRLLVQNPKARLSGKQALHHPWIVGRAQAAHGLEP